jgi:ABC-type dipeptide/oligopeptide/nickel transport system ATPase component
MKLGRILEAGPVERVFTSPDHPYARALLSSVAMPERRRIDGSRFRLTSEPRSAIDG